MQLGDPMVERAAVIAQLCATADSVADGDIRERLLKTADALILSIMPPPVKVHPFKVVE